MIANFGPEQKINRKGFIPLFELSEIKKTTNLDELSILKIDVEGVKLEVQKSFYDEISEKK